MQKKPSRVIIANITKQAALIRYTLSFSPKTVIYMTACVLSPVLRMQPSAENVPHSHVWCLKKNMRERLNQLSLQIRYQASSRMDDSLAGLAAISFTNLGCLKHQYFFCSIFATEKITPFRK